jgi:hypothetical protein
VPSRPVRAGRGDVNVLVLNRRSDDDAAMTGARPAGDATDRRARAARALDGYPNGTDAPLRATARALEHLAGADTLVLVEGISDQIAVETAASAQARRLEAEGVVIVPIGGAHAIGGFLATLGALGPRPRLLGLCDVHEQDVYRRALVNAQVMPSGVGIEVEPYGFFVCVDDLEDELIRAVGVAGVEAVLDSQGDLGSFRTLQHQPAWWGRAPDAQLRRFLGSGSRRKLRYARLLVEAAAAQDNLPRPLEALLASV